MPIFVFLFKNKQKSLKLKNYTTHKDKGKSFIITI